MTLSQRLQRRLDQDAEPLRCLNGKKCGVSAPQSRSHRDENEAIANPSNNGINRLSGDTTVRDENQLVLDKPSDPEARSKTLTLKLSSSVIASAA